jgi:REP element-mobilizing transposase RayT
MTPGYRIRDQSVTHFLTFTVVDWVDIFSRKRYRDILLESLSYCRKVKGLEVYGYVIMTNHVHCILKARKGNLSNVIRDFKRYTATEILKSVEQEPESRRDWMLRRFEFAIKRGKRNEYRQFWEHDNHPEEVYSVKFFLQKLNYIHQNPVKAGWVTEAEHWLYSSMRNYCGLSSLIAIDVIDLSMEIDLSGLNSDTPVRRP